MYDEMYTDPYSELYHHGIKGQKWGVRRYQNEDGSLTPEGKEHYHKEIERERKIGKVVNAAIGAYGGGVVGFVGGEIAALSIGSIAALPVAAVGGAALGGVIATKTIGKSIDFQAEEDHMYIESGKYFMESRLRLQS